MGSCNEFTVDIIIVKIIPKTFFLLLIFNVCFVYGVYVYGGYVLLLMYYYIVDINIY